MKKRKSRSPSYDAYDESFDIFNEEYSGDHRSGFDRLREADEDRSESNKKEADFPDPFAVLLEHEKNEEAEEPDWLHAQPPVRRKSRKKNPGTGIALAAVLVLLLAAVGGVMYFVPKPAPGQPQQDADTTIAADTVPRQPSVTLPVNTTAAEPTVAATEPVETEPLVEPAQNVVYYYRERLSSEEKAWYDRIYSAAMNMSAMTEFTDAKGEQLYQLMSYVLMDHPEIFWMDGSSSWLEREVDGVITTEFTITYTHTPEERAADQAVIDAYSQSALSGLYDVSAYEQIKGVYDYIINHTNYEYDYDAQNICDVMIRGKGVCAGYAKTTQYLLQQLGIETLYVSGYGKDEPHAWNIVKADGAYYELDTTWGDPILEAGEEPQLNYYYFCITTEEMHRDHTPDDPSVLPVCTATACNYFIYENRYFEAYNRDQILNLLRKDVAAKAKVEMKFASSAACQEARQILVEGGEMFEMLKELGENDLAGKVYQYVQIEEHGCLAFLFDYT